MKFVKLRPSETTTDHEYQRGLDEKRVKAMAEDYQPALIGVPVVSKRSDGSIIRIDGQHRIAAAIAAGHGETPILVELHDGLAVRDEAELFLRLNGGRKAVKALDRFKARVVAREPIALEILGVLKQANCRVVQAPTKFGVMAIDAVESAYHRGNLPTTMNVLVNWLSGEPDAFNKGLIRGVSTFLDTYKEADALHLASKLRRIPPAKVIDRLDRERKTFGSTTEAARYVFFDIYNHGTAQAKRLDRYDAEETSPRKIKA
jgi:hypothetical protein